MPEKVSIPIAQFQYEGMFVRPVAALLLDRAAVVQAVFNMLEPYALEVDNVEPITTGKASEQGLRIKLPKEKVTLFFGPSLCRLNKDDVNWSDAEEIIELLSKFLSVLSGVAGAEIGVQRTALAFHAQLKGTPFMNLLKPFLPAAFMSLESGDVKTGAVVVVWKDRKLTLDGSGALANGLFLRLERDFSADKTLQQIGEELRADEVAVFETIGIEEEIA